MRCMGISFWASGFIGMYGSSSLVLKQYKLLKLVLKFRVSGKDKVPELAL